MQVIVYPSANRTRANYSIATPEVDYPVASSNYNSLVNVARYEQLTWQLVMDALASPDWRNHVVYDHSDNTEPFMLPTDHRSLAERLRTNHLLTNFFPQWNTKSLEEMKECLLPLYQMMNAGVLADVYSHDLYDLEHNSRTPIVLFNNGCYLAHIYMMNQVGKSANFIGIRESITNMLKKANNMAPVKAVGYQLLYACYSYVVQRFPATKYLQLEAPIGPMPKIAERFGFKYGETYDLSNPPQIQYQQQLEIVEEA
jgi:hypothetical protein